MAPIERDGRCVGNIVNYVDESPSLVYMAIGWLAREGKIEFLEAGKRIVEKLNLCINRFKLFCAYFLPIYHIFPRNRYTLLRRC